VERAVTAKLVSPAGEIGLERGVGRDARAREVRPAQQELEPGSQEAAPAPAERRWRRDLPGEHRESLERSRESAEPCAQAEVREDPAEHLQRFHLAGVPIRAVHDREARTITEPPAFRAQAPGKIDVLAVHEKPRLESANARERRAPKEERGAAAPAGVERHRVIVLGMLVGNLAQLPRRELLVVAGRLREQGVEHAGLEHAILVQQE
jgi:hypothetical protein